MRENCRDAEIVFDKFHVMKLIGEKVDDVRKAESVTAKPGQKQQKNLWLWRKNPEIYPNLNRLVLPRIDPTICGRQAYQMRLALQKIYSHPVSELGRAPTPELVQLGQPSLRQSTLDHEAHAESCRDDTKTYR